MKFCKNLQRIADITNPEWAPYWPNYKLLKKLIKELPMCPAYAATVARLETDKNTKQQQQPPQQVEYDDEQQTQQQQASDKVAETNDQSATSTTATTSSPTKSQETRTSGSSSPAAGSPSSNQPQQLGKHPGEVAFFKVLHAEVRKVTFFFERALRELKIREERVKRGVELFQKDQEEAQNASQKNRNHCQLRYLVSNRWNTVSKSIFQLYKDCMLLETFAIMAYCSFSKILKKHDKVSGYETKTAFMTNIVQPANFSNYPQLLTIIEEMEHLYEQAATKATTLPQQQSQSAKQSEQQQQQQGQAHAGSNGVGKQQPKRALHERLYEDERLFLSMIQQLNEQVMDSEGSGDNKSATATTDGSSNAGPSPKRKKKKVNFILGNTPITTRGGQESQETSALRTLIEETKPSAKHNKKDNGDDDSQEESSDESTATGNSPVAVKAARMNPQDGATPSAPNNGDASNPSNDTTNSRKRDRPEE